MEDNKVQVNDTQPENPEEGQLKEEVKEQTEEVKEEPSVAEQALELAKALQIGYTKTREEFKEVKNSLQEIADSINQKSGAQPNDENYATVKDIKEILAPLQVQEQSKAYVNDSLKELWDGGLLKSEAEEKELLNFVLKIKEHDIPKAYNLLQEVKAAREEGRREILKTQVKQQEGSKIGTSSKQPAESRGVNIRDIRQRDWFNNEF